MAKKKDTKMTLDVRKKLCDNYTNPSLKCYVKGDKTADEKLTCYRRCCDLQFVDIIQRKIAC